MLDWSVDESWTLFLDRDGVINERIMSGYVLDYKDFHFKEGVLDSFASLSSKFKYVFVVTNQQCVALEKISEADLTAIHQQMKVDIEKVGGKITQVFAATELKDQEPFMRKPSMGMGKLAKSLYPDVDFSKAIIYFEDMLQFFSFAIPQNIHQTINNMIKCIMIVIVNYHTMLASFTC
jgi:histidinol-phosphate phosphatase family protein